MGRPKALLPFRGETFLDHLIGLFAPVCDPVIVALGHESELIRSSLRRDAVTAFNPDYRLGQLTSMQRGLREVPAGSPGVLFTLVDHPDPSPGTLEGLIHPALISVPTHGGRKGHPVYFQRALIPEFLALTPESSARPIFQRYASETRFLEVDDPGILDDVDDPEALRTFLERTAAALP